VSYAHGQGLNCTVPFIESRWALFLDPDFYLVVPQWCSVIPDWMQRNGVAFFGATYQPEMWRKYRHFPTAICMFVDMQQVRPEELDFRPTLRRRTWLSNALERHLPRLLIGSSTDVGWQIFARQRSRRFAHTALAQGSWKTTYDARSWNSKWRALIPDRYLYMPKHADYGTELTFASYGYPDPTGFGKDTDEYFWQGRPFGFHVRSRIQSADLGILPQLIDDLSLIGGQRRRCRASLPTGAF
jgi:hypothetical protein